MSDLSEISKNENGEGSMSRNAIKYLAMAAMFCNHFAYIFLKKAVQGRKLWLISGILQPLLCAISLWKDIITQDL